MCKNEMMNLNFYNNYPFTTKNSLEPESLTNRPSYRLYGIDSSPASIPDQIANKRGSTSTVVIDLTMVRDT